MPSEQLYQRALDIRGRYRYNFYDSLVIAAALDSGEDLQHNQKIEGNACIDWTVFNTAHAGFGPDR